MPVILGGNSHPQLLDDICGILGTSACDRILAKFSSGESRCEIKGSVRGKDVYIIQTGAGKVNDALVELLIMISALKTGSAKKVTAVLPLFPYSRQPDLPYHKSGAPLSKPPASTARRDYTFESVPVTPGLLPSLTDGVDITRLTSRVSLSSLNGERHTQQDIDGYFKTENVSDAEKVSSMTTVFTTHDYDDPSLVQSFMPKTGYKKWVAQAGNLVAELLTCAGADHIKITLDLHDSQYQGFFDVPVDNLYARPLLTKYITRNIPNYQEAVIVSPDAGGAKRATSIADSLGLSFSIIHKERRPIKITERQNATMLLVGNVADKVCILVDDLVDTSNTLTRAAKLLKKEGATKVYALVTHAILSGDAIDRLKQSSIDKLVTTNSVPQHDHKQLLGERLDVLDISPVLAEAIRRAHYGESMSALFAYD